MNNPAIYNIVEYIKPSKTLPVTVFGLHILFYNKNDVELYRMSTVDNSNFTTILSRFKRGYQIDSSQYTEQFKKIMEEQSISYLKIKFFIWDDDRRNLIRKSTLRNCVFTDGNYFFETHICL